MKIIKIKKKPKTVSSLPLSIRVKNDCFFDHQKCEIWFHVPCAKWIIIFIAKSLLKWRLFHIKQNSDAMKNNPKVNYYWFSFLLVETLLQSNRWILLIEKKKTFICSIFEEFRLKNISKRIKKKKNRWWHQKSAQKKYLMENLILNNKPLYVLRKFSHSHSVTLHSIFHG